jgi:hypothetical protein
MARVTRHDQSARASAGGGKGLHGVAGPLLVTICLAAAAGTVRGRTLLWNNAAGGTFGVFTNRNPNTVPSLSTHTAVCSLTGPYSVTFGGNATNGTLLFQ